MIILFDEDSGTTIPTFLRKIGLRELKYVLGTFHQQHERQDTYWLTEAGQKGWLVFSCNKNMLEVANERATILRESVGIVFLTSGQEHLPNVLRLLLNKWEWLERIDREVKRPFVFYLYPNGRIRRVPL